MLLFKNQDGFTEFVDVEKDVKSCSVHERVSCDSRQRRGVPLVPAVPGLLEGLARPETQTRILVRYVAENTHQRSIQYFLLRTVVIKILRLVQELPEVP